MSETYLFPNNQFSSLNIETSSIMDSRDTSYLNEEQYQPRRIRRRTESASDLGDASVQSDDVKNNLFFSLKLIFFFL